MLISIEGLIRRFLIVVGEAMSANTTVSSSQTFSVPFGDKFGFAIGCNRGDITSRRRSTICFISSVRRIAPPGDWTSAAYSLQLLNSANPPSAGFICTGASRYPILQPFPQKCRPTPITQGRNAAGVSLFRHLTDGKETVKAGDGWRMLPPSRSYGPSPLNGVREADRVRSSFNSHKLRGAWPVTMAAAKPVASLMMASPSMIHEFTGSAATACTARGKAVGEVFALPTNQSDLFAVAPRHDPKAVVLDLVQRSSQRNEDQPLKFLTFSKFRLI